MTHLQVSGTDIAQREPIGSPNIDAGLRVHMQHVYNYLAVGIGVSAIVAYALFLQMTTTIPTTFRIGEGLYLTPFGKSLLGSVWVYALIAAPLLFIIFVAFYAKYLTLRRTQIAFWLLVILIGAATAIMLLAFQVGSAIRMLAVTAAAFAGLSLYGHVTKRDMSGWGTFLCLSLIGLIGLGVFNTFNRSSGLETIIAVLGLLLFSAFTAYDTQQIKLSYLSASGDGDALQKEAVWGALNLFLDFWNMFLDLLTLFGNKHV